MHGAGDVVPPVGILPSICNPGNGDGGPEVQGHPQLFYEFKKSGKNKQKSKYLNNWSPESFCSQALRTRETPRLVLSIPSKENSLFPFHGHQFAQLKKKNPSFYHCRVRRHALTDQQLLCAFICKLCNTKTISLKKILFYLFIFVWFYILIKVPLPPLFPVPPHHSSPPVDIS